jgi:hypothetical protein
MAAKSDIPKIGIVSTAKGGCVISVRLPDKHIIPSDCPECRKARMIYKDRVREHKSLFPDCECGPAEPNRCHHLVLDGFEIDFDIDDSDYWCCYFTTDKTNDVLEALSLVKKLVEWVKAHMIEM